MLVTNVAKSITWTLRVKDSKKRACIKKKTISGVGKEHGRKKKQGLTGVGGMTNEA